MVRVFVASLRLWNKLMERKNEYSFIFILQMSLIRLNKLLPVVLFDTSYFIFYRYFSTLKWYQFRNKNIVYTELDTNEEFVKAFEKHVYQDFKKICKQWKTDFSNMIFCCDCSREHIWRNEHHEYYKGQRVQNPTFNPNIFVKFYEYLERNENKWGTHKLCMDHLEADDIVYLTKKKLIEKGWNQPIVMITNDNDYLQLLDGQTHIFNMNGKGGDLSKRSCGDPVKDLKIKIIMGDVSDNIPAIHQGIGPKTAMKLASLPEEEFANYLNKHQCQEIYSKNKKLIDFSEIPNNLCEKFYQSFSFE